MDGYKYENSMVEEYDEWRENELINTPYIKMIKKQQFLDALCGQDLQGKKYANNNK